MLQDFFDKVLAIGFWGALLFLGVAVALAAVVGPWRRFLPQTARCLLVAGGLATAGFSGGYLKGVYGDNTTRSQLRKLEAAVEISRRKAADQARLAADRLAKLTDAEGQVEAYTKELADGKATKCASDPTYNDRLRRILEGGLTPE